MGGNPRRDLAKAVDELEQLVNDGADHDAIQAKMHEASAALRRMVEAGGTFDE